MTYQDKAEITREYYREQGEARLFEDIIKKLEALYLSKETANWSPKYIIKIVGEVYEARKAANRNTNA